MSYLMLPLAIPALIYFIVIVTKYFKKQKKEMGNETQTR